jgi:hypothetical protein
MEIYIFNKVVNTIRIDRTIFALWLLLISGKLVLVVELNFEAADYYDEI